MVVTVFEVPTFLLSYVPVVLVTEIVSPETPVGTLKLLFDNVAASVALYSLGTVLAKVVVNIFAVIVYDDV